MDGYWLAERGPGERWVGGDLLAMGAKKHLVVCRVKEDGLSPAAG